MNSSLEKGDSAWEPSMNRKKRLIPGPNVLGGFVANLRANGRHPYDPIGRKVCPARLSKAGHTFLPNTGGWLHALHLAAEERVQSSQAPSAALRTRSEGDFDSPECRSPDRPAFLWDEGLYNCELLDIRTRNRQTC